jgi:hypothetical protein
MQPNYTRARTKTQAPKDTDKQAEYRIGEEREKMDKYYYFCGHDSCKKPDENAFLEFDSLQELADHFYESNCDDALSDSEYVFDEEEYLDYINE